MMNEQPATADPAIVRGGDNTALEEFYDEMHAEHLEALWRINTKIMPLEPRPKAKAWLWRFDALARLAEQAGKLVPIDRGGDRRVLAAINPGLKGSVYGATSTLWAAVQYLGPRELAPGHRHSPSALRFVVEGTGAWTTVNGDRCHMTAGDLVLTPAWSWHDHQNEADEPMMWFDGLDLPLVSHLDAQFFEFYPVEELQPVLDTHGATKAYQATGLLPVVDTPTVQGAGASPLPEGTRPGVASPLLRYPWEETAAALDALRDSPGDPHDDVLLRFTNPGTGGGVLPTLDACMQLLRDGVSTSPHRHVHSTVYQVFRGRGESIIDGVRFSWQRGDIIALPPWAVHEHHAPEGDAILFSITDEPVIDALGLQRILPLDGPQKITGDFTATG
jgi:gentisate 1,2-dioxygenase